jgi:hypothetical protein
VTTPDPTPTDAALDVGSEFPLSWFPFAGVLEEDLADVPRQVDRRLSREPELAPRRDELIDLLTEFANDLTDQGALFGALRWEDHPDWGVGVTYGTATIESGWPGIRPDEVLAEVRNQIELALAADPEAPKLEPVDLPAGPAIRLEATRVFEPDEPTEPAAAFLLAEYWLAPTAEGLPAGTIVHLAFLTTNPAYAPTVVDEYAAIAERLWLGVRPA